MSAQIGQTRYLSYNSGSYESPSWVTIDMTKDCKIPLSDNESDASVRSMGGFSAMEPGLTSLSYEFNIVEDRDDTVYQYLRAAKLAKSSVDLWASDLEPGTTGASGMRAVCKLFKFDTNETLGDVITIDIVAKPCVSTHAPTWYAPA